ncbi:glycosyltransferase family 2 protein [Phaeodactylibacter xiamenensis]|uniref:glycosyltransferase family 2 protein n=1 Tax=Phaeodactylibacter xiamenensis TaxID=1524460 RepID=UPI003CCBF53A
MPKLSVLLPTFNNEAILLPTLESVKWADELLVVDSYSTDGTVQLARSYGAKVIQHEYINSASQKNWALPQCKFSWVLQIDSDEVLEPGAEKEIRKAIAKAPNDLHCFRLARKNDVLGKWIRFGGIYPDWEHRLFRKDKGKWFDREVHSNVRVPGKVETLKCHIIHYGTPNLSKQIKNLDRYTRYEADELKKRGKTFSYFRWFVFPWLVFGYKYIWLQGFRDGWRGFFLAVYAAFYYFIAQSKLKELEELNLEKSP